MSYRKRVNKTEGGQGGKIGHSIMDHRDFTEVIKKRSNRNRRNISKDIIKNSDKNISSTFDE